jgi:hypothetical protein
LSLATHIYRLCELGGYIKDRKGKGRNPPALYLSLNDLLLAVFFIACDHQGIRESIPRVSVAHDKNKYFHTLFTKSFSAFENWPQNYFDLLNRKNREKGKDESARAHSKYIPCRELSRFYTRLSKHLPSPAFDFMRHGFVRYFKKRWPSRRDFLPQGNPKAH